MRFDLIDLRLLLNIAETGSITGGACKSHMALAAASSRVRAMEDALGAPLLIRGRRGITLTASGHTAVHHGRLMLRQLEAMKDELGAYTDGAKGHIRLLCNTPALSEFLPDVLVDYLRVHSGVDIDVEERLASEIVQALAQGKADVGVIAGQIDAGGIETLPFREDRLVVITSRREPLLGAVRSVRFADILQHDFVGLPESSALHQTLESHASQLGKRLRYRARVRGPNAICQLVEGGIGIGIVSETAAVRYRNIEALRQIPLDEPWAARTWILCAQRFSELQPLARQLVEILRPGSFPVLFGNHRLSTHPGLTGMARTESRPTAKIEHVGEHMPEPIGPFQAIANALRR